MKKYDNVDHPEHYNMCNVEVIDVIDYLISKFPKEAQYSLGNVIKYICRAPYKGKEQEDLNKAHWYTNHCIIIVPNSAVTTKGQPADFDFAKFVEITANGYAKEKRERVKKIFNLLDTFECTTVMHILALVKHNISEIQDNYYC